MNEERTTEGQGSLLDDAQQRATVPEHEAEDVEREDIDSVLAALLERNDVPVKIMRQGARQTRNITPVKIYAKIEGLAIAPKAIIAVGGGGVVLQCVNENEPRIKYALKITRPSLLNEIDRVAEAQRGEIAEFLKHAPLSHRNIARVYGAGKLEITVGKGAKIPITPMLMEWINEPHALAWYLANKVVDWRVAVELLASCFDALQHVHEANLIHWDVKSDNILVDVEGIARLSDMGSARRIAKDEQRTAYSTRWNLPPALTADDTANVGATGRRSPINVPDGWDVPWIDLWMLARDLNRLFEAEGAILDLDRPREGESRRYVEQRAKALNLFAEWRSAFSRMFSQEDDTATYALAYIRIILRRLLAPLTPYEDHYYDTGAEVANDLRKLLQPLGAAHSVPELHDFPQHVVRLPVWGNAPFTKRFNQLYNTRMLRRLSSHLQLGGLVQVYPGAAHRRFEHSAGVYAATIAYVRALYANLTDPFWRLAVDEGDIEALLAAALLHDVGHIAFGHFLEEMEGLFHGHMHEQYAAAIFNMQATTADDELLRDRAEIRRAIIRWAGGEAKVESFLRKVASILRRPAQSDAVTREDSILLREKTQELKTAVLHSILDSAIDSDKLDYLARDAHHCNVQYAKGIDVERFLQCLTAIAYIPTDTAKRIAETHKQEKDRIRPPQPLNACIAINHKGIAPVESILVARYQMFSVVYWHHTGRALTAVLHFVVQEWVAARETGWQLRLAALVAQFRRRTDRDALKWLKTQVNDEKAIRSKGMRNTLSTMCDALMGSRDALHWPAFELQYRPGAQDTQSIATSIMAAADRLNRFVRGFAYVEGLRAMRKALANQLQQELGNTVSFAPGDVLIDIPPAGKDQVDNVFVVGEELLQIQDVSPLAHAVRRAFRLWVRKLRVFMSPDAWQRCKEAGNSDERIRAACLDALRPQRTLFTQVAARTVRQRNTT